MARSDWSHILLVEDHPGQLQALMELLTAEGYQAVGCSTASQAMTHAKRQPFGVAVVDVQLPDDSSIQLFKVLKSKNRSIRIIINTALATVDAAKEAINLGVFAYLEHPGSTTELLSHIRRAFRDQVTQYTETLERAVAQRTAELEDKKEHFQQLVEHIHEVYWISSLDRRQIFYVSPLYETVWGRSAARLIDHPEDLWEAIHPEDQPRVLAEVLPEKEKGFQGEFRILRPDYSIRWVRAQTFFLRNSAGEPVRLAGVAEDITEQKKVEAALVKTERQFRQASRMEAIGTLAGGIAHDFNNILTAILGYTELGLASVQKGSRTQRNLQEVLTAGHRAKHLVLQILAFSRQSGPGKKTIPIHTVIREGVKLIRATLPSTITISQSLKTEATILADPTQIHQVVVNLCTNAEYAMRETGGRLEILLEDMELTATHIRDLPGLRGGPHVRLTVKDNGAGMASDILERMFDPFFTTKPYGEGSGMGLAVVHGIVASHGGSVVADSILGQGTKVEVYLPSVPAPAWEGIFEQGPLPVGKETILFVDDEETIVHLGKELLTYLGYTVEIHTNSLEALNQFRQDPQRFDLVITDQTMPGMTGEGLSRELLRIRPDLPIILCTGFSHLMSAEKAKALGIQAYLMKPLVIRDLAPIVRHVLDKTLVPLPEL